jgi:dimethylargininase
MLLALTRDISAALTRCELTHRAREPIDLDLARAQHAAYEACLRDAGCRVERLAAEPDMPDSVFIEDTAIVFDEVAIMTRPGAASRRGETAAVAGALERYRPLHRMESPATADGGDFLLVGRHLFVGRTSRTNTAGIDEIGRVLIPYGYRVTPVEVHGCLHLKSAVTAVGHNVLLMNPQWVPAEPFAAFDRIDVHPGEPAAANALQIGDHTIYTSTFPRTLERMQARGLRTRCVEASEVAKAEGALTCCSLVFEELSAKGEPLRLTES